MLLVQLLTWCGGCSTKEWKLSWQRKEEREGSCSKKITASGDHVKRKGEQNGQEWKRCTAARTMCTRHSTYLQLEDLRRRKNGCLLGTCIPWNHLHKLWIEPHFLFDSSILYLQYDSVVPFHIPHNNLPFVLFDGSTTIIPYLPLIMLYSPLLFDHVIFYIAINQLIIKVG